MQSVTDDVRRDQLERMRRLQERRLRPDQTSEPVGRVIGNIQRADSAQTAHPAQTATVPQGFALLGGGAEVHFNGAGSLLWKLEPSTSTTPTFSAASKDHSHPDPSTITVFALSARIG